MARENDRAPTPMPVLTEVQRVEAQCDERHRHYSKRHNKTERRMQQLFGDDDTKTPGLLYSIEKNQAALKDDVAAVKTEVQGLKLKLAVITSVIMILVQLGYHFISKV
jgi:hypothetical protein